MRRETGEPMFQIGQLVVYGGEGVCRVGGIGVPPIPGADRNRQYYTLSPLCRTGQVMTPVDTKVMMRPVMSREEAEVLIESLPALEPEEMPSSGVRAAKDYYHQLVTSYDCRRLAGMIKAVSRKRVRAMRSGKKVSQMDERYLKRAEEELYSELAAALELEADAVPDYIRRTCPAWPEN